MVGKWKITQNYIGGKTMYAAYRLKDTAEVDHSGNREFATGYMSDKQEVTAIVEKLNQEA